MSEAAWLNGIEPDAMLTLLRDRGKFTERKARLFAAAACYRIRRLLTDERRDRNGEYDDGDDAPFGHSFECTRQPTCLQRIIAIW